MKSKMPGGQRALDDAWKLLRLSLRDACLEHARPHLPRVSSLPPTPPDPDDVVPVARAISNELERLAGEDVKSPVLRYVKLQLIPSGIAKTRKRLLKAVDKYLLAWKAEHPGDG